MGWREEHRKRFPVQEQEQLLRRRESRFLVLRLAALLHGETKLAGMLTVEGERHRLRQGHGLRKAREHRGPRHTLQDGPMPTHRSDEDRDGNRFEKTIHGVAGALS